MSSKMADQTSSIKSQKTDKTPLLVSIMKGNPSAAGFKLSEVNLHLESSNKYPEVEPQNSNTMRIKSLASSTWNPKKFVLKKNLKDSRTFDFRTSLYPPQKRHLGNDLTDSGQLLRIGSPREDLVSENSSTQRGRINLGISNRGTGKSLPSETTFDLFGNPFTNSLNSAHFNIGNNINHSDLSTFNLERGVGCQSLRRNFKITKKGMQGFLRKKLHLGMRPAEAIYMLELREVNGRANIPVKKSNNIASNKKISLGITSGHQLSGEGSTFLENHPEPKNGGNFDKEEITGKFTNSLKLTLSDIDIEDQDFVRHTKPTEAYFARLGQTNGQLAQSSHKELEEIVLDFDKMEAVPVENKMNLLFNVIGNWIQDFAENENEANDALEGESGRGDSSKRQATKREGKIRISKAMSNVFRMVDKSIKSFSINADDVMNNLPYFFELCDKLILKEIEAEKGEGSEECSKALSEVCAGLNYLIHSSLELLFKIPEDYLTNLVKGYLQNLFQVFFDLTELDADSWIPRLHHIGYQMLTLPENIDGLFGIKKFLNYCLVAEQFYEFFERFYTCILSLIIKSEFFVNQELLIWRFILDLFAIHFIFFKSLYLNLMCRRVIQRLPKVTAENIMLRYMALVCNIPQGFLIYDDIRHSLKFNNQQLCKSYQNTSLYEKDLIVHLDKPLVKSMLQSMFKLIDDRYNNETEQKTVIDLVTTWMQIIAYYINYSNHYSPSAGLVETTFELFRHNFNELLYRMKSRKTTQSNKGRAENCWRLILEACDGLGNQLKSPIQSPSKRKKSTQKTFFQLK